MTEAFNQKVQAHQEKLQAHLESLGHTAIGDLSDDDVRKMQLRLDVLDKWAKLNRVATMYPGTDDHDHTATGDDHVHHAF